jgi:hypothetical protein
MQSHEALAIGTIAPRRRSDAGESSQSARPLLAQLTGEFDRPLAELRSAFQPAVDLFGQAALAYEDRLDLAAVLVCRAALEAAACGFLARRHPKFGTFRLITPRLAAGEIRPPGRTWVWDRIRRSKVLAEPQLNALDRILAAGDPILHVLSVLDARPSERKLLDGAETGAVPTYSHPPPRFGIEHREVYRNLRETVEVILVLARSRVRLTGIA